MMLDAVPSEVTFFPSPIQTDRSRGSSAKLLAPSRRSELKAESKEIEPEDERLVSLVPERVQVLPSEGSTASATVPLAVIDDTIWPLAGSTLYRARSSATQTSACDSRARARRQTESQRRVRME